MRSFRTVLIAAVILLACIIPANAAAADIHIWFEILTDDQLSEQFRAAPAEHTKKYSPKSF